MLIAISNGLLYVALGVLMGTALLNMIPKTNRPELHVPFPLVLGSALLLPVLSFPSLLEIARSISAGRDRLLSEALEMVMFSFQIGTAWISLTAASIALALLIVLFYRKAEAHWSIYLASMAILAAIIGFQASVGHAASASSLIGFTTHTMHYLAVSVWIGTLFVVSWFSKSYVNWEGFLEWFTLIAVGCVVLITMSGLIMSQIITESITGSWVLSYGQALLLKHLLFAVILLFAIFNAFFIRGRLKKDASFSPRSWLRAESTVALTILAVTGFMTEQETPQRIERLLRSEGPSPLYALLFDSGPAGPSSPVFSFHGPGLVLILIGGLFAWLAYYSIKKEMSAWVVFGISLFFAISMFLGLISMVGLEAAGTAGLF